MTDPPARVVDVDPLQDNRWDGFVEAHPRGSGHHLGAWAAILRSCYGYRPRYMALEAGGRLQGVLPLVNSGRRLSGSRLSSLPTAKAAGPLAHSEEHELALLAAARERRRREGLSSLLVRSQTAGLDAAGASISAVQDTQVLQLDRTPEQLLDLYAQTNKNLSRSIRKAERSGLSVTEAGTDRELREWYRLYLLTIRRHRNLPRRLRQLREARERLGHRWRLIVVKKDGAVVAGGVFHDVAGTIELIYNASDRDSLSLRPNHALYWHVINDSIQRGRRAFDFGVSNHASLAEFKAQWGAQPRAVYLYTDAGPGGADAGPGGADARPGATDPGPGARPAAHAPAGGPAEPAAPHAPGERAESPAGEPAGRQGAASRPPLRARAKDLAGSVLESTPPQLTRALGAIGYRLV
jgi:CelD/BcsL family acetyltransferase involved in cellulose biosynthesis